MKQSRPLAIKLLFLIIILTAIFLSLSGIAIAYVLCVDHMAEFFNGWNYQNDWFPFRRDNYFEAVPRIPHELYTALYYFPEACFASLILFPAAVIFFALVEVCRGEYAMLLMGWLPFMAGLFIGIYGGFFLMGDRKTPPQH